MRGVFLSGGAVARRRTGAMTWMPPSPGVAPDVALRGERSSAVCADGPRRCVQQDAPASAHLPAFPGTGSVVHHRLLLSSPSIPPILQFYSFSLHLFFPFFPIASSAFLILAYCSCWSDVGYLSPIICWGSPSILGFPILCPF